MRGANAKKIPLVRDERGAIMVLGLGSACLLIGALWFLMGIADTIVWREKVQEAVDSAAFSTAAANAYGMNFIAALNLVILALVTIHLIIGLVANALAILGTLLLIPPVTPAGSKVLLWATKLRSAQTAYDAYMMPISLGLGASQIFVAVSVPQAATLMGMDAAKSYDVDAIAMGPSNVPAPGLELPVGKNANGKLEWKKGAGDLFGLGGWRLGLPVALEPLNAMCKRPYFWVADWLSHMFQKLPGIRHLLEGIGKIAPDAKDIAENSINETMRGFTTLTTDQLVALECNSGLEIKSAPLTSLITAVPAVPLGSEVNFLWGMPGGKKMWGVAKNDSQWMQVWAWTRNASKVDDEERKVAVARRKFGDVGTTSVEGTYVAQAEFYFDCTSTDDEWDDVGCNGYSAESQLAIFNMRWRARLRRYNPVNLGVLFTDTILSGLDDLGIITDALGHGLAALGLKSKLGKVTDLTEILRKAIDDLYIDKIRDEVLKPSPDNPIIH